MSLREMSKVSVSSAAASAPGYKELQASRRTTQQLGGAPPNSMARSSRRAKGEPKTVRLSAILRQVPSSVEANKISVVEKFVTEVDELPDRFLDVEVLFLSHNSISTMVGFRQFRQLRMLSIACNCIEAFSEIEALVQFPSLQVLNLEGNPVTIWPFYRLHAISRLPKLKMLDSKEVKPTERESAPTILKEEGDMLQLMFSNYFLQKKLEGAMTRIKLHSELMAVMYGRMSTLNRVDLPPPTSLNTRKYLECWDIENHLGSKERDIVLAELRLEVRRVKLSQSSKDLDLSGAAGMSSTADILKGRPGMSEHSQWDLAFKHVSLSQQTAISRLLSRLQDVKAEAETKAELLHKQSRAISRIRAENDERERNAVLEREALIRELRAQVGSLEAASGLSITTLSPVKIADARRLGACEPDQVQKQRQKQQQQQQQLSAIAAAPRTDGRRLPSGRQVGGAAKGASSLAGDDEHLQLSFDLPDEESSHGDTVPFIATKCTPISASATAAKVKARSSDADLQGKMGPGAELDMKPGTARGKAQGDVEEALSGEDADVPAPRAPPRPMEQGGSAQPSPAKRSRAVEGDEDMNVRNSLRTLRESMSVKSAEALRSRVAGVGVWEGGWGLEDGAGENQGAMKTEEVEDEGSARLTELTRALGRLSRLSHQSSPSSTTPASSGTKATPGVSCGSKSSRDSLELERGHNTADTCAQQLDAHDTALKRIRQSAGEIRQSLTPEPPVQARSADPVLVAARSDGAQAESLQAQVRMLQDDIRRRASEEERLIRVNSQLKERVEEAMDTNNRNVEAAESELLRLSQELQATRERADQTAEQARVEMQRVKEESARREEAALRAVEEAEARGRAQMERMRSKVEDETRDRMRADVEESLRQERERAELAAEETRKLLEARIKALQTMVDTLSTSEGSMEDALQKQLSDVNNRNGQLESALLQARGDFKKLTQEAAVVARKAETHLKTIYEMQGMQRRAEQAEDLHDLLLLRRSLLHLAAATARERRVRRIDAAASVLGDRSRRRYMFNLFHKGVQLTVAARLLCERVVARRITSASTRALALVEDAQQNGGPQHALHAHAEVALEGAGEELNAKLQQMKTNEDAALGRLTALAMRCGTYSAVLQAAAADEDMCRACCVHLLGSAFAHLSLYVAQQRVTHARAATLSVRSEASVAAFSFRQIATETKHSKTARTHAVRQLLLAAFAGWRTLTSKKRAKAARVREGVLFQTYLQRLPAEETRSFLEQEGRVAMGVGTSAGASALLWMLAARHEWLRLARSAFGVLRTHWAEKRAAHHSYHSGERELLYRAVLGWAAIAQRARVVKLKSEEAQRMRARRLLALARGSLLEWRRQLTAAHKLRLHLAGLRLRRESGAMRRLWCLWRMARGQRRREKEDGIEDELEQLRLDHDKELKRAHAADVEVMQLTDKLQLLSADKAKVEVELAEHRSRVESMAVALDEADIMQNDLRLQLERRRLQYEELEQQQKELRSQASDKHLMSVTTAATLELEKESVSALRAQLKEALENLKIREEQLEVCQSTLRETLDKLHSTTAHLQAKEEEERRANAQALASSLQRPSSASHSDPQPAPLASSHDSASSYAQPLHSDAPLPQEAPSPRRTQAPTSSAHLNVRGRSDDAAAESLLGMAQLLQTQHDFAKRKRAIDSQFRERLAGMESEADKRGSGPMTGSGEGPLLVRRRGGGFGSFPDEENVAPNHLHSAHVSHGGKGGVTGHDGESGDLFTPSPGILTEHQKEMRSLHHEIEALQSRILSRLNSNPTDMMLAHADRAPSS